MRDPLPANANSRHTGKLESHGVRTLGRVIPYRQDADGGHEELTEPPFDFSSTPAPVGALG